MNASENDSASLSCEKHDASCLSYHFDNKVQLQNVGVFMCVGLPGRRRAPDSIRGASGRA